MVARAATVSSLPVVGRSRSLADEAADSLRDLVLSGGLAPGERLNEVRLAAELGISRAPLREALQQLRGEGLLRGVPRRGSFVVALTVDDIVDVYELRAAIEGRAARLLATRLDPAGLRALRRSLARIERAARNGDAAEVRTHDLAFHEAICRLSGNKRLHQVFLGNVPMLRSLLKLDEFLYASQPELAREHEVLLAAIESGDSDKAEAEAVWHLERARDVVTAFMRRRSQTA